MEPHHTWIVWAVVAVLLMVAEAFTMSFFIFWFGVAAVPVAVFSYFYPEQYVLQVGVYIILVLILILSTRRFAKTIYEKNADQQVGSDRMLNKIGFVTERIDPPTGKGMVRVEHDFWRAETEDGSAIAPGAKVRVLRIDGTRLIVGETE